MFEEFDFWFQLRHFLNSEDRHADDSDKEVSKSDDDVLLDDILDDDFLGEDVDLELDHLSGITSFLQNLGIKVRHSKA